MGLVWVILFPLGAIIIRFLGDYVVAAVVKHQIMQIGALVFLLGGGAFGIYLCRGHQFTLFRKAPSTKTVTDRDRPYFWACNNHCCSHSSWFWMVSPQKICSRQTNTSTLVYTRSFVARSNPPVLWTIKLRIRSRPCRRSL
jgi:hypothetical protein